MAWNYTAVLNVHHIELIRIGPLEELSNGAKVRHIDLIDGTGEYFELSVFGDSAVEVKS